MHKVVNVQELFDDSVALYDDCIVSGSSSADAILGDLYAAYENLKNCWEAKDAGVQINNIVLVYNELVGIRNALAKWAESATKVAADYRDVQNSNGAGFESFVPVRADEKYKLAEY